MVFLRHPLGTLVLVGLVACAPKPPATPAEKPITITLADYSIDAPSSIPSGYTTFHAASTGKELHHAQLLRFEQGKTVADFTDAMKTPGPPPPWVTFLGGAQLASDVSLDLAPGNYAWVCLIPGADGQPHVMKGMSKAFTVTDAKTAGVAPVADITVEMSDYKWNFSTPLTAGHHTLKISTAPGQPHEFALIKLAPGKTAANMAAWADKPEGPPPAESVQGIPVLQNGSENYLTVDVKPGSYVLMCFVPDGSDGKAHAMHGMVQEITIQ